MPRWLAARDHPPHHGTHAVHVCPRPEFARSGDLLQGRVPLGVGSHRLALIGHDLLRRPEVDQHGAAVDSPDEDVGGLDVAVEQSRFMHTIQALQQRHHHAEQVGLAERPTVGLSSREHLGQRAPVLKLYHHVRCAVRPEEVPARNHARVVLELHKRLRLIPEASQTVLIGATVCRAPDSHTCAFPHGKFDRQVLLDGHSGTEFIMLRPIDDAEAAVPDNGLEGVFAQSAAYGQSVSSR